MAKDPAPATLPTASADEDEDFFKSHGIESDEDKTYLKAAWAREEYLEHRRKLREKKNTPTKKSMFKRD